MEEQIEAVNAVSLYMC